MQNDPKPDERPPERPQMLRLLFEVPADGLRDLVELLAPLKHIAYRSDLWLTREDASTRATSDNGSSSGETSPNVSREPL